MKRSILALLLLSLISSASARDEKKNSGLCDCDDIEKSLDESRFESCDERQVAFDKRLAGACLRTKLQAPYAIEDENNKDQERVPKFAANFSKLLPHDEQGILTKEGQKSYKKLLKALKNGQQSSYDAIDLASETSSTGRKLVSPQTSAAFSFIGIDSSLLCMPLFPRLSSDEAAAQILEVYLLALTRDVNFDAYTTDENAQKALKVLNDLGAAYEGPKDAFGDVTSQELFRGNNAGAVVGPYVSQLLYFPISLLPTGSLPPALGANTLTQEVFQVPQKYPVAGSRNFGITVDTFVAIQNGAIPQPYVTTDFNTSIDENRFLITGRDLASRVHTDQPAQLFLNAANVLINLGFPFCPNNPYYNGQMPNEEAFGTIAIVDLVSMISMAMQEGIKHAWAHKWRAQRVLRPEAFAGLINLTKEIQKNKFCLNEEIFKNHAGVNVLECIQNLNGTGTCLMPLAYPEGSPAHPSYPAGHAVVAGACMTVLKAFFDDTKLFKDIVNPVKPTTDGSDLVALSGEGEDKMTVGGELEKLASNIDMGRNFAGIHYRADGDNGSALGEEVAIKVLQDHAATITEQEFKGFELTKLNGTRIRITAQCVEPICAQ